MSSSGGGSGGGGGGGDGSERTAIQQLSDEYDAAHPEAAGLRTEYREADETYRGPVNADTRVLAHGLDARLLDTSLVMVVDRAFLHAKPSREMLPRFLSFLRGQGFEDRYIELGVQSYNANLAGKALVSAYDSLLAIIADKGAAEASKFVPAQNSTIALANSVVPIEDRGVSASFLKWFTYESGMIGKAKHMALHRVQSLRAELESILSRQSPACPSAEELQQISHLKTSIKEQQSYVASSGKCTASICKDIVRPLTAREGCCRFLELKCLSATRISVDVASNWFGSSDFFVSHAWSGQWADVVDMIVRHSNRQVLKTGGAAPFYWIDIFAINQWKGTAAQKEDMPPAFGKESAEEDVSAAAFAASSEGSTMNTGAAVTGAAANNTVHFSGFRRVIHHTKQLVLLLGTVDSPKPLARAWCLFELWLSHAIGANIDVLLTSQMEGNMMNWDGGDSTVSSAPVARDPVKNLAALVLSIDLAKADASNPKDKRDILAHVNVHVNGGVPALNETVATVFAQRVVQCLDMRLDYLLAAAVPDPAADSLSGKISSVGLNIRLFHSRMVSELETSTCRGRDLMLATVTDMGKRCRALHARGEASPRDLAIVWDIMACALEKQGGDALSLAEQFFAEAVSFYEEDVDAHSQHGSQNYLNETINSLRLARLQLARFQRNHATAGMETVAATYEKILDEIPATVFIKTDDPIVQRAGRIRLAALGDLGILKRTLKEFERARVLFTESFEGHMLVEGTDHVSTLRSEVSLGNTLNTMKLHVEAEPHFDHALAGLSAQLGDHHQWVMECALNASANALLMGNKTKARALATRAQRGFLFLRHEKGLDGAQKIIRWCG
jgi:hypothetical protein